MIIKIDAINRTIHIDEPISLAELEEHLFLLEGEDGEGKDWVLIPSIKFAMSLS